MKTWRNRREKNVSKEEEMARERGDMRDESRESKQQNRTRKL